MSRKTIIAVWFSCGAASAVAAKKTIEIYGRYHEIVIINNPVDEEDSDNKRFLLDVSKWLGRDIIEAKNDYLGTTSAVKVWDDRKYMAGIKGEPCTMLLKKAARQQYEATHNIDWHVLGFTFDEIGRHERFVKFERANVLPVLIKDELTKENCFKIIEMAGIKLPNAYYLGYPNANCIGCVKATSPTYWNHVRKMNNNVFEERAEQSRRLGVRLVRYKGKRIYLDELPNEAVGGKMKSHECGIFCETKQF
jgi:hypothetical protein